MGVLLSTGILDEIRIALHLYDPAEGLEEILRDEPDIVFLDIEMGGLNGVAITSQLPPDSCFRWGDNMPVTSSMR